MAVPLRSCPLRSGPSGSIATVGIGLIVVAVALTVGWQILGVDSDRARRARGRRAALLRLLLRAAAVPAADRRADAARDPAAARGAAQRAAVQLHQRGHPRAEDAGGLAPALPRHAARCASCPTRRSASSTGRCAQDLERLNGTITNVLNAAMYTERPLTDPQPLDLARLVRRAIELTLTRNQLPAEALRYEGPEALVLRGDAGALETAVLNLLDNAVKYSRDAVQVRGRGRERRRRPGAAARARPRHRHEPRPHRASSSTASIASAPRCGAAAPAPGWACSS